MNYPIDKLHVYTLNVGFARHDGDWNWKNVRSPFARLYLVVEGKAQISLPSGTYDLTPGHLYYIPSFTTHSYICDSLFTHYYVHIYENNHEAESILDNWDFPVEADATEYDIELFKRLAYINPFLRLPMSNPDIYDNHKTLVSNIDMNLRRPFPDKVESRGILFILLSRFLKNATPKVETGDDRIRMVLAHIRGSLSENIDVESLANKACMSKDHFIRTFKRHTGDTPIAYITKKENGSSRTTPHNQRRHYQEHGYEIGLLRLLLFQKDFQKIFRYHAPAIPRRAQGRHLAQRLRLRSSPRGRFRLRLIPQRQGSIET